jgi:hypothetical protein
MRVDLTLAAIRRVRDMLAEDGDDDRLLLDMLEGETDALDVLQRILNAMERDEGDRDALTAQMESRKARRDRYDARLDAYRKALAAIMGAVGRGKLTLPEATLSLRTVAAKLAITDKAAVPDALCEMKTTPSMAKINAAYSPDGTLPNWLTAEPARPSIIIRRK